MKKVNRVFCLTILVAFMLGGVSFATPIEADYIFEYTNPGGGVGARVYLDVTTDGDLNKYIYQIQNVGFDPIGDGDLNPINSFLLPVTSPLAAFGWEIHEGDTHTSGVLLETAVDGVSVLQVTFNYPGVQPVDRNPPIGSWPQDATFSQPFYILTQYDLDFANSVLRDGGEGSANLLVLSNLDTTGGGADTTPVPEPGTLMLIGSGILGIGGLRIWRFRNR